LDCAWIVLDSAHILLKFFLHSSQAFLGLNSPVKRSRLTL
jgi:hypothetical protein